MFLLFFGASARTAFASSVEQDAQRAAKVKLKLDSLAPGTVIKVKLKDHRKIEGELVARSEESFQLNAPESTEVSYTEVKSIAELGGQVSPGGTSNQPARHHGHFARNAIIAFAVVFGLTVLLVATNKS
ncbi:MAG TPA: hypothetical protein VGB94_10140 [Acidobacteriaceae bacterium]